MELSANNTTSGKHHKQTLFFATVCRRDSVSRTVEAFGARRTLEIAVIFVARRVAKGPGEIQPRLAAELARRSVDLGAGPIVGGNGVTDVLAISLALESAAGGRGDGHRSEGDCGEDEVEGDHGDGGGWFRG